jgi:hypothetical protein
VVPPAVEDAAETETGVPGSESGPANTSRSSDGAVVDWCEAALGVLAPPALAPALALATPTVAVLPALPVDPSASALRFGLREALEVAAARGGGAE